MTPHRFPELRLSALLLAALLPACVLALPEDAAKEIVSDYTNIDFFPDQSLIVFKGSPDEPTCITQGSLEICGNEIRLERMEDGSLKKVTATGSPVRFQQQPAADEEIVHASGLTLVYDSVAQLMTIDDNAELSRAGYVMTHQHIEYNLETGSASADGGSTEQRGRMTITPAANSN